MTDMRVEARPAVDRAVAIAVVDSDEAVRSVLVKQIEELDLEPASFEDLDTLVAQTEPLASVVAVVGPSLAHEDFVAQARDLISLRPTVAVVMVVFELTPGVLQQGLRAGVDDVVAVSAEVAELTDAIDRAAARLLGRAVVVQAPVEEPTPEALAQEGRVVTVFCTKGGAGKSVIAVNLAVALAKRSSRPVVLVDADLQFGDVALMLELQPSHTIAEAVAAGDPLDAALLGSLMLKHEPSGLLVLAAPTEPGPADHIGKADLARILTVLRGECEYIVVDTSANFGEITLAALQHADDILVVAGLDVMSLKSAKVGLQTMEVLGVDFSKIQFVLNRANTQVGLSKTDAERVLQLKVDVALPSDLTVAASVNRGTPVVVGAPKSKFARGIEVLAIKLAARARAASLSE